MPSYQIRIETDVEDIARDLKLTGEEAMVAIRDTIRNTGRKLQTFARTQLRQEANISLSSAKSRAIFNERRRVLRILYNPVLVGPPDGRIGKKVRGRGRRVFDNSGRAYPGPTWTRLPGDGGKPRNDRLPFYRTGIGDTLETRKRDISEEVTVVRDKTARQVPIIFREEFEKRSARIVRAR